MTTPFPYWRELLGTQVTERNSPGQVGRIHDTMNDGAGFIVLVEFPDEQVGMYEPSEFWDHFKITDTRYV